ncbi:MAG: HD domain-containing protein [Erysipelotrichaceae bacterium]|nr:HD domain-containing protein [Erysipelotrichaceae bacterium]
MRAEEFLKALHVAERLKDATRHCYTSQGRHESVGEHSWRVSLMAYWVKDEFPEADIDKVIRMCLIHDLGEAFTGDIPTFLKTDDDRKVEDGLLEAWVDTLPSPYKEEMKDLYREMEERKTLEARIYKALDSLEALIQHNESDIATWSENEYALNMTYADDKVAFSQYLKELREVVREETKKKILEAGKSVPAVSSETE